MRKVSDRTAHPLPNGRVDHRANVVAGGTTVPWSCLCGPEDGHDHDATHKVLMDRLEERGEFIDELHALVGRAGRVGLVRYKVVDCNLQIHGPAKFVLYVAWIESSVSGLGEHRREFSRVMESPSKCMSAAEIVSTIEAAVRDNGNTLAQAIRRAGEFASK